MVCELARPAEFEPATDRLEDQDGVVVDLRPSSLTCKDALQRLTSPHAPFQSPADCLRTAVGSSRRLRPLPAKTPDLKVPLEN
jgi:hypothetical protein